MSAVNGLVAEARSSATAGALLARFRGRGGSYPLGYLAALDGARGFLTIGVLAAHTKISLFGGAMVYMDVFFTMSGYLITSLLLKEYDRHGGISLRKFYVRRLLRLYPALAAMLIFLVATSLLFSHDPGPRLIEALVTGLYLTNYVWLWVPGYFPLYTGHTWSLAVEEQFYLLWPLVFIGILRLFGVGRRAALAIFALAAAFWALRGIQDYNGAGTSYLYTAFEMRADGLLVGCGLAFALRAVDLSAYPRLWRLAALSLAPLFLAYLAAGFLLSVGDRWFYYCSPLLGSIPSALAIVGLLYPHQTFMHRLYQLPAPVFVGRICYGLYIWHFPIFMWVFGWAGLSSTKVLLVGWPLTFLAATLSYFLIERPFMRARPGL